MSDDLPDDENDIRQQLETVSNPPGILPTALWGRTSRSRVFEFAVMIKAGLEGLGRPLSKNEVNAAAEYVARRSTRESYLLWSGGALGAFLSTRKTLRAGWVPAHYRPFGPPPPAYNGWNIAGFPARALPPRASFFIRAFFNVYFMGNTVDVLFGSLFSSDIPQKLSDPDAFERLRAAAKQAVENSLHRRREAAQQMAEQNRQGRQSPPEQLQQKDQSQTDQPNWSEKQPNWSEPKPSSPDQNQDQESDMLDWKEPEPVYKSRWDEIRTKGVAQAPRKTTENDRERAQREFDEQLDRERRGN